MKYSTLQSAEEIQYVQVKMKKKQRKLGTESHLSARNEGGGKKRKSVSIPFCLQQ